MGARISLDLRAGSTRLDAAPSLVERGRVPLELEPWGETSLARIAPLAAHPSLQPEFERLLGHGLAETMGDPFCPERFRRIARLDGADVGFGFAFVLPTVQGLKFASLRVAVIEPARRRGVGGALWRTIEAELGAAVPDLREIESGVLLPGEPALAFFPKRGLAPVRRYWLMRRPSRTVDPPAWPAGVSLRPFADGERDVALFTEVFNRSWKEEDHGVLLTVADVRTHIANGTVDPRAIFFAEAAGAPIGFVRGALHATRGEVAVLGVVPEWRGRGVGRALLRFGTRWLIDAGADPVTLLVDGKNERALTLYRQEGFEIMRTREIWSKRVE